MELVKIRLSEIILHRKSVSQNGKDTDVKINKIIYIL